MPEVFAASLSPAVSRKSQRTALDAEALAQSFLDNLFFVQGRSVERATVNDLYLALAHTVRDRIIERWLATIRNYQAHDVRVIPHTWPSQAQRPKQSLS
jgi:starch phosphorylase